MKTATYARIVLTIIAATLVTGCATAKTFRSSTDTYAPVRSEAVLVFFEVEAIKVPYKELGEILVEGSSGWGTNQTALIKKAQKEAGKMGANAILVRPEEKVSGTERAVAALFGTKDNKRRVTALRLDVPKTDAS